MIPFCSLTTRRERKGSLAGGQDGVWNCLPGLMLLAVVLAAGGKPATGGPLELIATLPDGANVAALTTDAAGNLYVAGFIEPDEPRSAQDSRDVFVAKLTRGGSQLVYWTTFGGSDSDSGQAVAAGRDGSVYVTGTTTSRDFPATPGALQTDFQADGYQAFVAKLDADGKIEYQTLVGGSANTSGRDIFANQAGDGRRSQIGRAHV